MQVVTFNLRKSVRKFRRAMRNMEGSLRHALWAVQEAQSKTSLRRLGFKVLRPGLHSDVALMVPNALGDAVGDTCYSETGRWMVVNVGELTIVNCHVPVIKKSLETDEGSPWSCR